MGEFRLKYISVCPWIFNCTSNICCKAIFPPLDCFYIFAKNHLDMFCAGLFLVLYSSPLICVTIPHSTDSCSHIRSLQNWADWFPPILPFFFKNNFSYSSSFEFPCKFLNILAYIYKKNLAGISRGITWTLYF